MDGNKISILGLIWMIILHFQVIAYIIKYIIKILCYLKHDNCQVCCNVAGRVNFHMDISPSAILLFHGAFVEKLRFQHHNILYLRFKVSYSKKKAMILNRKILHHQERNLPQVRLKLNVYFLNGLTTPSKGTTLVLKVSIGRNVSSFFLIALQRSPRYIT